MLDRDYIFPSVEGCPQGGVVKNIERGVPMPDNVDSLLMQLRDEIENGKKLPGRRIVDPLLLEDIIDSVRKSMPATVEQSRKIVADRNAILAQAHEEERRIVARAKQEAEENEVRANKRVQEVVETAKKRVYDMRAESERILAEARAEAALMIESSEITRAAHAHAEEMLRRAHAAAEEFEIESRRASEQAVHDAKAYSNELLCRSEEWAIQYTEGVRAVVGQIVGEAEETLSRSLSDVRNTQKQLQAAVTKAAQPPAFDAPEEPAGL